MTKVKYKRSPLFYVGDKYKLVEEIKKYLPQKIRRFIEPFVGGASVSLNITADEYILNDLEKNVILLHKFLTRNSNKPEKLFKDLYEIIDKYQLSCSCRYDNIPKELKINFPKTYYAKYNKEGFTKLKEEFNFGEKRNTKLLYILLIYGFNRMLRFNKNGEYNLPVGNVDFNSNVVDSLINYLDFMKSHKVKWYSQDYKVFLEKLKLKNDDFVYLDPPYLITFSEYNKYWNEKDEQDLLNLLDELNDKGVKFAISNVTHYKGKENNIFIEWASKYNSYPIKSNYINYHDNSIKKFNEVLITNYK